jgi:hypothetical protein
MGIIGTLYYSYLFEGTHYFTCEIAPQIAKIIYLTKSNSNISIGFQLGYHCTGIYSSGIEGRDAFNRPISSLDDLHLYQGIVLGPSIEYQLFLTDRFALNIGMFSNYKYIVKKEYTSELNDSNKLTKVTYTGPSYQNIDFRPFLGISYFIK